MHEVKRQSSGDFQAVNSSPAFYLTYDIRGGEKGIKFPVMSLSEEWADLRSTYRSMNSRRNTGERKINNVREEKEIHDGKKKKQCKRIKRGGHHALGKTA